MTGKYKGVQSRILSMFPKAFFNPCGCHSLNLVIGDAVASSVKNVSLFGVLQRLYVLFSSSTKRWKILKESQLTLTVKEVCETRWECRINSVKAVRYQMVEVCEALQAMQEELIDPKVTSEAKSLENNLTSFDFIVSLVVCHLSLIHIFLTPAPLLQKYFTLLFAPLAVARRQVTTKETTETKEG